MEEERHTILRMLAEGKITPAEAAALLDALEVKPGSAARRHCPSPPATNSFADGLAGLAGRMASWGAEFGGRVAEEIRENRVPALNWIADCFDGRETVTERSGLFDRDEARVEFLCGAGSLLVRGGDGADYRLSVRQRFGRTEGPSIDADGDRLSITGNGLIRAELVLPRDLRYRLRLKTSAGRIDLGGIRVREGAITTEAGNIKLDDLSAEVLTVRTSAGSIDGVRLTVSDLWAETDCGGIHLGLAPATGGKCRLATDIGTIALVLTAGEGIGYRLRAETHVGSIWCAPFFQVQSDENTFGHRRLAAASPGWDSCSQIMEVEAGTDCGSIRINAGA